MFAYLVVAILVGVAIACFLKKKKGMSQAYTTGLLMITLACMFLAVAKNEVMGIAFLLTEVFGVITMAMAMKEK